VPAATGEETYPTSWIDSAVVVAAIATTAEIVEILNRRFFTM
jgi:hypothetical protein